MVAVCVAPIKAQVIRITRLDACGKPITGASSAQVVLDGFTEVKNTPNYEEGQRFLLKKANGSPCVNEKDPSFLNWIEQEVTLCTMDPDAIVLVTGERLISSSTTGIGVALGEGLLSARFSVEVWQPISGNAACTPGGVQQYMYWAFPNEFDAKISDFTFANDTFTFGWKSMTDNANILWTLGATWLPGGFAFVNDEHYAFNVTAVAPPAAVCGAVTI